MGQLRAGERVLTNGAPGSAGTLAVQVAQAFAHGASGRSQGATLIEVSA